MTSRTGSNAEGVKQWGITVPYALVEIEVNSGLGSPANGVDGFVATNMKRLDGTRDYPLDVPEVINRLRKDYQAHKQDEQKAIDAAMEKAQTAAMSGRRPTEPRETEEEMYVTWLPEAQRLQVRFRTRVTDGEFHPCGYESNPPPQPSEEHHSGLYGTLFGVEFGMGYEVTKTGRLEQTLALPIKGFHRDWKFSDCPLESPRIYPLPHINQGLPQ